MAVPPPGPPPRGSLSQDPWLPDPGPALRQSCSLLNGRYWVLRLVRPWAGLLPQAARGARGVQPRWPLASAMQ